MSQDATVPIGGVPTGNDLFVQPTVLKRAKTGVILANEETFGPVAPLFRTVPECAVIEPLLSTDLRRQGAYG